MRYIASAPEDMQVTDTLLNTQRPSSSRRNRGCVKGTWGWDGIGGASWRRVCEQGLKRMDTLHYSKLTSGRRGKVQKQDGVLKVHAQHRSCAHVNKT